MRERSRDLRRIVQEMYAAHCVLGLLGFRPEELFVSTPNVLNGNPPGLYATLIVQRGELSFLYNLAPRLSEAECDRFLEAWRRFAESGERGSLRELDRMVKRSQVWRGRRELLLALAQKGFRFTAVEN